MSGWNYVVTAHKPTNVTHSCVGNFTNPQELNLIIAKCTRIEIHLLTAAGLQTMLDVPIYGRIATLELFRPPGDSQDLLFLSFERYKFCILQWDAETSSLVTRAMGDLPDKPRWLPSKTKVAEAQQIVIVDPDCRLIVLHLYAGRFKVIPIDSKGQLKEAFLIRLKGELEVLDIKFLYGCSKPTIAVLYQDSQDARHVKTYKVQMKEKDFGEGPWLQSNLDNGAGLLIPVPLPLGGAIIIGEQTIVYYNGSVFKDIRIHLSITKAYGKVDADGSRYLLSDDNGMLYLLVITHDNEQVLGLKVEALGETSAASSLSYLDNGVVYIGSSYGDSQLIKLNSQADAKGSYVEVLESFVNLGPIVDLCVVDLERQGQGQVVTCSGAYKDGSLRIVRNAIGINEKTLFCHNAIHDQLIQVTASTLRLVDAKSRRQLNEWKAPSGISINVSTANASQVLLATGGGNLVYIEIGQGTFTEVKHAQLEYAISCLDINPVGDNPEYSSMAAVGLWTDISVCIFALPSLILITKESLGGEVIPRSVLFCSFEGIAYLLCALGDGHLFNFMLKPSTGELSDRKKISLGTQPIALRTFRSKNATHVFAASDRSTVIYSSNKKLLYSNVNLKEVNHMCPFNSAPFPDSLAIGKEGELTIGTIDDIQKLHIRTVPLGEHACRISHQEHSRTFAICSTKYSPSGSNGEGWLFQRETHYIRLIEDQTFEIISSFPLDHYESGLSIITCSFTDDSNSYYCVGTVYERPEDIEEEDDVYHALKGRILVFIVEDGKLQLVTEKETKGGVYNLNAFNGKLLAGINQKIQLYKWTLREDGARELQYESSHRGRSLGLYVKSRGDFIVVGDMMKSISLLIYKPEGAIEEHARDYNANCMTAVEILDDDTYLGAEDSFNLFTMRKNSDAATDEERGRLEVVGEYHLGEFVNCFQHGSLVMRLPDSEASQIPTVIFGTVNGVIGVVASLPQEQYLFLHKLQQCLVKVIKGVGNLSHEQWRSFCNGRETVDAHNFLDGDLIESFLDLSRSHMEDIAISLDVPIEELCKQVEELTRLH
ncbi:hypothetical protein BDL97_07G017700 [Sphagnum fallax]|nr:hypothetical protein BDL97_07G017700 [Sphagnum fallax]